MFYKTNVVEVREVWLKIEKKLTLSIKHKISSLQLNLYYQD